MCDVSSWWSVLWFMWLILGSDTWPDIVKRSRILAVLLWIRKFSSLLLRCQFRGLWQIVSVRRCWLRIFKHTGSLSLRLSFVAVTKIYVITGVPLPDKSVAFGVPINWRLLQSVFGTFRVIYFYHNFGNAGYSIFQTAAICKSCYVNTCGKSLDCFLNVKILKPFGSSVW